MTPEGTVKDAIKKLLHKMGFIRAGQRADLRPVPVKGWYYMPLQNGMGVHGIPDFIACWNGRFLSIEAKAPGKEPTGNQTDRGEEIQLAQGIWLVVEDVNTLVAFFNEHKASNHDRKTEHPATL